MHITEYYRQCSNDDNNDDNDNDDDDDDCRLVKRNVFSADRSDAERWITEMISQQVPDHRTCRGECLTSKPTATMTWYDQLMASGRQHKL